VSVDGLLVNADGTSEPLDRAAIAAAPEAALRLLTASTLAIAAALLALRL
jgi:predicted NAD/FAD-binding protein